MWHQIFRNITFLRYILNTILKNLMQDSKLATPKNSWDNSIDFYQLFRHIESSIFILDLWCPTFKPLCIEIVLMSFKSFFDVYKRFKTLRSLIMNLKSGFQNSKWWIQYGGQNLKNFLNTYETCCLGDFNDADFQN